MSSPPDSGGNEPNTAGLRRLFEDLTRDGWLMGMDVGLDPIAARMDPETGTSNTDHFRSRCEDAVRSRRESRNPGALAVVSVRLFNWDELCAGLDHDGVARLATEVAVRIEGVLRLGDLLGRTRVDTFSLLLEDYYAPAPQSIGERCVRALKPAFEWSGVKRLADIEVGIWEKGRLPRFGVPFSTMADNR